MEFSFVLRQVSLNDTKDGDVDTGDFYGVSVVGFGLDRIFWQGG